MTIRLSTSQARAAGIIKSAPKKRGMNKWEREYGTLLYARKTSGEILWWGFEAIKLRLATKTFYTPDFAMMHNDGSLIFAEVKGFMRDDSAVKLKVAAEQFPFTFMLARKVRGQWEEKVIPGRVT